MLADDIAFCHTIVDNTQLHVEVQELRSQRLKSVKGRKYEKAALSVAEEEALLKSHREKREAKEAERQRLEAERFIVAKKLLLAQVQDEWKQKQKEEEKKWQERSQLLESKHANDKLEAEQKNLRQNQSKYNIHSKYVRDMLLTEKKLAESGKYAESQQVRRKIQDIEKHETDAFHQKAQKRQSEKIKSLHSAQAGQAVFLTTHIKNERHMFRRKMEAQKEAVDQRLRNLEKDMLHAHKTEFHPSICLMSTITKSAEQDHLNKIHASRGLPHGVTPGRAATYRGSQLLLRLQGKYPLPSLCSLYDPENPSPGHPRVTSSAPASPAAPIGLSTSMVNSAM